MKKQMKNLSMSDMFSTSAASLSTGSVECLGQTFASDEARRAHFVALMAEKLKDPAFRKQEGFPLGTDEAILTMSDPPYYTGHAEVDLQRLPDDGHQQPRMTRPR